MDPNSITPTSQPRKIFSFIPSAGGFTCSLPAMKNPLLFSLCASLSLCAAVADDVGVRLRLGLADTEATDWSGTVTVAPGRVTLISGWRFAQEDKVNGVKGWSCRTRPQVIEKRRSNNPAREQKRPEAAMTLPITDNGVLISLTDVTDQSKVSVKTAKGEFAFKLADLPLGKLTGQLGGAVEVERTAAAQQLTTDGKTDDDYPSAAVGADGTTWIVSQSFTPGLNRSERAKSYVEEPADMTFLAKAPGGDQLWLRAMKGRQPGEPIAVTPQGRDIYKSAVAVDGKGIVWIFWAENSGYQAFPNNPPPNFDIFARSLNPEGNKLGEVVKLSDSPENDVWPVAATDAAGAVWVAWQGSRDKAFRILERHQSGDGWSKEREVSTQKGNCWAPAIATKAVNNTGAVAIAWDTYDKGDYDVWVREFDSASGNAGEARPAANTADYEARLALTYDRDGALWIAWEQSGATWGKDWGALVQKKGIGLYRDRQIGLAVLKDGQWMEPATPFANALPGAGGVRKRQLNVRVPAIEPGGESRKVGQEAEAAKNLTHNNLARLVADEAGRVWLFTRTRQNDFRTALGSLWLNWAAYYDGDHWVGPILVPHSDNLLYNTPVVVPQGDGALAIIHSSDHRQDRTITRRGTGLNNVLESDNDPFDNDLYVSRVKAAGTGEPVQLVAATREPTGNAAFIPGSFWDSPRVQTPFDRVRSGKTTGNLFDEQVQAELLDGMRKAASASPATGAEREDVARCRAYRSTVGGKELRILRGEFHRHTEISGDGGNDGPLEDMWRYAIDVAAMDWLGCGDHDNGGGREYPWWLTQKTTDAFFLPGVFNSMFTYERSVRYPEGHRNVVFTQRGIRTLSRLPKLDEDAPPGHAPDTQMLYKYLRLFDGVCASHTSATDMGTDWRDWDAEREPMVEIYQGCRQNYERPGAPRCPTENDAIGGWRPKGFVNLALLKGYKFAFESSSDHTSTHISYALVYAEAPTRDAILKAMKQRHVYAATDNIVADFRCGEHMMGDEFSTSDAPKFRIHLEGTGPFKRVVFVKDDVEIFTAEPKQAKCDVEWTDPKPEAGKTSYYYVRGEQENGELVWASPMWIKFEPAK